MINWKTIRHFTPGEFSENPDEHAAPELIMALDQWREFLGFIVNPSPVSGALARFSGDSESRHYAVGRLSDAVDVFASCHIRQAWLSAMRSKLWGGIGVYFDTQYQGKSRPMLHLDLRPGPTVIWYRINHVYGSPLTDGGDLQRLYGLLNAA